jgi:hypothetical protein
MGLEKDGIHVSCKHEGNIYRDVTHYPTILAHCWESGGFVLGAVKSSGRRPTHVSSKYLFHDTSQDNWATIGLMFFLQNASHGKHLSRNNRYNFFQSVSLSGG